MRSMPSRSALVRGIAAAGLAVPALLCSACGGGDGDGGGGNEQPPAEARVFSADDGVNGRELWRTDGTATGTTRVKDINGVFTGASSFPLGFTAYAGAVFFNADDGVNGRELWKTDGTEAGTVLVKDIDATMSGAGSDPIGLTVFNGSLYFAADDGVHGRELWKTDGTESGTVLVKDIDAATGASSYLDGFAVFDPSDVAARGALYFRASDGVNGMELWKTDGTEAGTVMVRNINATAPGAGSDPGDFATLRTGAGPLASYELFFHAHDGVNGSELWKTDGTEAGTVMVRDIAVAAGASSLPSGFTVFDGALYFRADDGVHGGRELWRTDGTEAGTALIRNINATVAWGSVPLAFTVFDGALVFYADDGVNGFEPWRTDGTTAGTVMVKNINATALAVGSLWETPRFTLTVFDGAVYFTADDGLNGPELWRTDGTTAGTVMVKDINASVPATGSLPYGYTVLDGALHFYADDGAHGYEPWKTDGTEAGTVLVADVCPGACSSTE